ncbi:Predicted RNA binding protein YcfA, dsRBD-like fold, HicA-like mRNA interferase family [Rhizobiales bacterium GAS113]|jgi:predicted RNA binding protein YcfA (HicA-like mRNA interferase family)|nr:Predicted RNA binding protein YcfA, dsRBD-like fold, HicA-like mRNA interferase family [Rhizobiales bacterium GAS113]
MQYTYIRKRAMSNRSTETPADVAKKLTKDGWVRRGGKGDHVNYNKAGVREVITLDMGRREIPMPILKRIYKIAGWLW